MAASIRATRRAMKRDQTHLRTALNWGPQKHGACTRFRTALKRGGVRLTVVCRECGKRFLARTHTSMAAPVAALP